MLFNPGLSKENILNFKPIKSKNVKYIKKKGKFFLEITRNNFLDRFFQTIFRVPAKTTLELDDIGKKVWSLCDGNTTVNDVVLSLKEEFGNKIEPALPRLLTFMRLLHQNRLITWER